MKTTTTPTHQGPYSSTQIKALRANMKKEIQEEIKTSELRMKELMDKKRIIERQGWRIETDYKFERMTEELRAESIQFRNQILTTFDPLLKELEIRQQDREIAAAQTRKIHNALNNHERRITTLEHS